MCPVTNRWEWQLAVRHSIVNDEWDSSNLQNYTQSGSLLRCYRTAPLTPTASTTYSTRQLNEKTGLWAFCGWIVVAACINYSCSAVLSFQH